MSMIPINFNFPAKLGPKEGLRIIQECALYSRFYNRAQSRQLHRGGGIIPPSLPHSTSTIHPAPAGFYPCYQIAPAVTAPAAAYDQNHDLLTQFNPVTSYLTQCGLNVDHRP